MTTNKHKGTKSSRGSESSTTLRNSGEDASLEQDKKEQKLSKLTKGLTNLTMILVCMVLTIGVVDAMLTKVSSNRLEVNRIANAKLGTNGLRKESMLTHKDIHTKIQESLVKTKPVTSKAEASAKEAEKEIMDSLWLYDIDVAGVDLVPDFGMNTLEYSATVRIVGYEEVKELADQVFAITCKEEVDWSLVKVNINDYSFVQVPARHQAGLRSIDLNVKEIGFQMSKQDSRVQEVQGMDFGIWDRMPQELQEALEESQGFQEDGQATFRIRLKESITNEEFYSLSIELMQKLVELNESEVTAQVVEIFNSKSRVMEWLDISTIQQLKELVSGEDQLDQEAKELQFHTFYGEWTGAVKETLNSYFYI